MEISRGYRGTGGQGDRSQQTLIQEKNTGETSTKVNIKIRENT